MNSATIARVQEGASPMSSFVTGDRYVSSERIRDVMDDEVRLDIAKDSLEEEA